MTLPAILSASGEVGGTSGLGGEAGGGGVGEEDGEEEEEEEEDEDGTGSKRALVLLSVEERSPGLLSLGTSLFLGPI